MFAKEVAYTSRDIDGNDILKKGFVLRYSPTFNIDQNVGIDLPKQIEVEIVWAEKYIARAKSEPVLNLKGSIIRNMTISGYSQIQSLMNDKHMLSTVRSENIRYPEQAKGQKYKTFGGCYNSSNSC